MLTIPAFGSPRNMRVVGAIPSGLPERPGWRAPPGGTGVASGWSSRSRPARLFRHGRTEGCRSCDRRADRFGGRRITTQEGLTPDQRDLRSQRCASTSRSSGGSSRWSAGRSTGANGVGLNYLVPPVYTLHAMGALTAGAERAIRRAEDLDRPQLVECSSATRTCVSSWGRARRTRSCTRSATTSAP